MNNQSISQTENSVEPSIAYSRQAWRRLGTRLRSLTPSQLTRLTLVVGAILVLGWLVVGTWPALTPFILGAAVAYALLPVVDWLDRLLPRTIAILLTLAGVLGLFALFLVQLLPPISAQLAYVYSNLPEPDEWQGVVTELEAAVVTLPGPVQGVVTEMLQEAADTAQSRLDTAIRNLINSGLAGAASLVNTLGFVLGFLVIPAWLLDVLRDQKEGARAINKQLPRGLRPDFWAAIQIIDRPFRAFIQGQVVLAVAAGIGIYLGTLVMEFLGWEEIRYKVLIAVLVALFQLIPSLGPIIAAVVLFMLGLIRGPETAVAAVILHITVQWLVNNLVAPHVERRYIDIHPAILLMVVVALSELGLLWVLVAAPLVAVVRDLFRYVYGRVSDPPLAAGVLPGKPPQLLPQSKLFSPFIPAEPKTAEPQVPLAYRRGRALRR